MTIVEDDLTGTRVGALLRSHLEQMHLNSPKNSVFAFDTDRQRAPDVSFWTAWDDDALLGCGALKHLDAEHGEIKSMRTAPLICARALAARCSTISSGLHGLVATDG